MFRDELLGQFTVATLADYLADTSLRTVQRWHAQDRAPAAVIKLLQCLRGDLGLIHPDWAGWLLKKDGFLWSPEDRRFDYGELRALQYHYARIRTLETDNKNLRKKIKELEFLYDASNDAVIKQSPTPGSFTNIYDRR